MISESRLQANRANAQKSTGPKTPAGKARASQNAVRHGLCSTTFVCVNEDLDEYYELRSDYMARYGPRDQVEVDLIDRMVHATWNLRRMWTMENETIDLQMFKMEGSLQREFSEVPERTRTAVALEELAKQRTLALLLHYQARQETSYQRALKTLLDLRKNFPLAPNGPLDMADPRRSSHVPEQTNPTTSAGPSPNPQQTEATAPPSAGESAVHSALTPTVGAAQSIEQAAIQPAEATDMPRFATFVVPSGPFARVAIVQEFGKVLTHSGV